MEIPYLVKNTLDAPDLREGPGAQGSLREGLDEESIDASVDADEQVDNEISSKASSKLYIHLSLMPALFVYMIWHWNLPLLVLSGRVWSTQDAHQENVPYRAINLKITRTMLKKWLSELPAIFYYQI